MFVCVREREDLVHRVMFCFLSVCGLYSDVCARVQWHVFECACYGRVHSFVKARVRVCVCVYECGRVFVIMNVGTNVYAVCEGVSV